MSNDDDDTPAARTYTRRQYLAYRLVLSGTPLLSAQEAVSSTALAHPEWDMDEAMTWQEWEAWEQEHVPG